MVTKHILVKGKVQGVFFRQSTREKARALSLNGSVKNMEDGRTVEIFITGDEEQLATFIKWCHEGPPLAKVQSVQVSNSPLLMFNDFSIL